MNFDDYGPALKRYLRRIGIHLSDIEDVVQETLLKAVASRESYDLQPGSAAVASGHR